MFDWGAFTLFLFIVMRVTGFILPNPIFGRQGVPNLFRLGFAALLSVAVFYSMEEHSFTVPDTALTLGVGLVLELTIGMIVSMVMRFFFYVVDGAGEIIDSQMGLSMGRTYDPGSQAQMTVTANLLNNMMMLLFFVQNGHITLLRLLLTSGEIIPFGTVSFGQDLAEHVLELFVECALLALKLGLPILAAEMIGQVGMGVLNKVIPQINVFVINIDLKILIGFVMLLMLLVPISQFLLELESTMLSELRRILQMIGAQ